jgi:DNA-binding NtrC family response regulator
LNIADEQTLNMPRMKILAVDNDASWLARVTSALLQEGHEIFAATNLDDAYRLLNNRRADLIIAEVNTLNTDGSALLEQLRQVYPTVSVIVFTSQPSITQAVQATRLGVVDYLEKPTTPGDLGRLPAVVATAVQARQLAVNQSSPSPGSRLAAEGFYGLSSQNPRMLDIFELIQTIADSYANVLIQGETGTGKELVARAVHAASTRHSHPFITLDCSALSRELLESELFGHEKGAFTGATDRHIGRFERAHNGTLFLDEVSNIDLNIQAKLLRVLQTRVFERVGGQKSITVDVRIVAASNRPLEQCVADGLFREDLFHRLNVVQIQVPPLRERSEDIGLLATEFLRRFARQHHKDVRGFTDAAIRALTGYRWPGNIRELENVLLQAVVLAKSYVLDVGDLPQRIAENSAGRAANTLADQLGEPERQILLNTLRQHAGNIKRAATALEISRTTLYAKLKKYQIDPDAIR